MAAWNGTDVFSFRASRELELTVSKAVFRLIKSAIRSTA